MLEEKRIGEGSVKSNGCYDDIVNAVSKGNGTLFEFSGASREMEQIENGIKFAKKIKLIW